MKWRHFEADSECDEFWASEIKIHKDWYVEVHVGLDRKTKKYDFQLLDQGREILCRTGYNTRADAETYMRVALITLLRTAVYKLEKGK